MSNTYEPAFAIPHNWQNANFTTSRTEQIDKARAAAEKNRFNVPVIPNSDGASFEMPAMLVAQLSTFDSLSGLEAQYNETVYETLSNILKQSPGFMNDVVSESFCPLSELSDHSIIQSRSKQIDVTSAYGYAAMRANRAYNTPVYLQMAQAAWEIGFNYTITQQQAETGNVGDIKNSTLKLATQCRSTSIVGSTYSNINENVLYIDAISSGAFLVLSGLLANATGNATYLGAATRSFQFMHDHLYSSITDSLADGIDGESCTEHTQGLILDSAIFLEGTAILASVTRNSTLRNFTGILLQAALSNGAWQNPQGVITGSHTTSVGDLGHLMCALSTVYELHSNDTMLQDYIRAFTAVQYNALLSLAADGDIYGGTWSGPPQGISYDYGNQSAAVDLLLSGILMDDATSNSSSNSTGSGIPLPTDSTTANGMRRTNGGAIAGGVVGGIIALSLIITLAILVIRQRRRRATMMARTEPFMTTSHDLPQPVTTQGEHAQFKRSVTTESPPLSPASPTVEEGGQRITLGSLIWELNELIRRGNRSTHDDAGPPSYTTARR